MRAFSWYCQGAKHLPSASHLALTRGSTLPLVFRGAALPAEVGAGVVKQGIKAVRSFTFGGKSMSLVLMSFNEVGSESMCKR